MFDPTDALHRTEGLQQLRSWRTRSMAWTHGPCTAAKRLLVRLLLLLPIALLAFPARLVKRAHALVSARPGQYDTGARNRCTSFSTMAVTPNGKSLPLPS